MKYLRLIRCQNLLLLAFMQLLFRYGFLKLQNIPLALADWQYGLMVLSTVLIAAASYVIDTVFDPDNDLINKPYTLPARKNISETAAYNIYVALNISGVAIGFYLSNVIMRPNFATAFVLIATAVYFYATTLKKIMILGNLLVALVLSLSVIVIGVFDLFPATDITNRAQMASMFSILLDYAIFAFMINFIRELVNDLEDSNDDYNQEINTLAVAIGISQTTKIIFALSIIPVGFLLNYINRYFIAHNLYIITLYVLLFVLAPLLYFMVKIITAKTKKEFHHLSSVLKWILFFGILSVLILNLNIKYNA